MSTPKEAKMTEAEFLDAQAEEARAAVRQTWAELQETLKESASLEVWAKRHPWLVAGTAVAGGFLIATAMFSPQARAAPAAPAADEKQETSPSRRLAWLVGPLFSLLRPVFGQILSSLLSGAVGAMTAALAAEAADEKVAASGEDAVPF